MGKEEWAKATAKRRSTFVQACWTSRPKGLDGPTNMLGQPANDRVIGREVCQMALKYLKASRFNDKLTPC